MAITVVNDIRLIWDTELQEGEFVFDASIQDLESDNTLETAIIISLFTDRRAREDDILPDPSDSNRRGWWGDKVADVVGDQIGSRLWLLSREKTVENVLVRAKQYIKEATQWLLDDKVVVKIVAEAERQGEPGNNRLAIKVEVYKIDGQREVFNFEAQWIAQRAR